MRIVWLNISAESFLEVLQQRVLEPTQDHMPVLFTLPLPSPKEPLRHDSGAKSHWNDSGLGPQFTVAGQKSELQTEKNFRVVAESDPNRPEQGPNGVEV